MDKFRKLEWIKQKDDSASCLQRFAIVRPSYVYMNYFLPRAFVLCYLLMFFNRQVNKVDMLQCYLAEEFDFISKWMRAKCLVYGIYVLRDPLKNDLSEDNRIYIPMYSLVQFTWLVIVGIIHLWNYTENHCLREHKETILTVLNMRNKFESGEIGKEDLEKWNRIARIQYKIVTQSAKEMRMFRLRYVMLRILSLGALLYIASIVFDFRIDGINSTSFMEILLTSMRKYSPKGFCKVNIVSKVFPSSSLGFENVYNAQCALNDNIINQYSAVFIGVCLMIGVALNIIDFIMVFFSRSPFEFLRGQNELVYASIDASYSFSGDYMEGFQMGMTLK